MLDICRKYGGIQIERTNAAVVDGALQQRMSAMHNRGAPPVQEVMGQSLCL
jgi:hypothetical protein